MFGGHEKFGTPVPNPGKTMTSKLTCDRCVLPTEQFVAEQEAAWGFAVVPLKEWR